MRALDREAEGQGGPLGLLPGGAALCRGGPPPAAAAALGGGEGPPPSQGWLLSGEVPAWGSVRLTRPAGWALTPGARATAGGCLARGGRVCLVVQGPAVAAPERAAGAPGGQTSCRAAAGTAGTAGEGPEPWGSRGAEARVAPGPCPQPRLLSSNMLRTQVPSLVGPGHLLGPQSPTPQVRCGPHSTASGRQCPLVADRCAAAAYPQAPEGDLTGQDLGGSVWGTLPHPHPALLAREIPLRGLPPRPELEHCLSRPRGTSSPHLHLHLLQEHRELWAQLHRPHLRMVRSTARGRDTHWASTQEPVPSGRLRAEERARGSGRRATSQPVACPRCQLASSPCVRGLQAKPLPCPQGLLGWLYPHCAHPGPTATLQCSPSVSQPLDNTGCQRPLRAGLCRAELGSPLCCGPPLPPVGPGGHGPPPRGAGVNPQAPTASAPSPGCGLAGPHGPTVPCPLACSHRDASPPGWLWAWGRAGRRPAGSSEAGPAQAGNLGFNQDDCGNTLKRNFI